MCRQLIYDDVMSGAIEEVTFEDGQEVDRYIGLVKTKNMFLYGWMDGWMGVGG